MIELLVQCTTRAPWGEGHGGQLRTGTQGNKTLHLTHYYSLTLCSVLVSDNGFFLVVGQEKELAVDCDAVDWELQFPCW